MKIDGYKLREAIKQHEFRSETASAEFPTTLQKFEDEKKSSPFEVSDVIENAEMCLAKLRTAQAQYNLRVRVEFRGEEILLAQAVKMVVVLSKIENLWKAIAVNRASRVYFHSPTMTRDPNQILSQPTVTPAEAATRAKKVSVELGRLKQAIATANAREVEIEGLDSALFELV